MRSPFPSLPIIYIRLLCFLLVERGYEVTPWLLSADIDPALLRNPRGEITLQQAERMLGAVEMGTGRNDWGFQLGRTLKLTSHEAVGFLLINADTVGELAHLCARYYRMINPLYHMGVTERGGVAEICFVRAVTIPERSRRFYDELIAASVHAQLAPFLNQRQLRRYVITMNLPRGHKGFGELRDAHFRFGAPNIDGVAILIDVEAFAIKNPMADSGSRTIAEEICRQRCADIEQSRGRSDWVTRVLRTAEGSRPTQAELAKLLNMSPRTLERALAREGASFKGLYEQVGLERACEMLAERRLSISAIAERLGYSHIGAFSRAFKRRSGVAPSEYLGERRA